MGPLRIVNIATTKPDKIRPSAYYMARTVYLTCEAREIPTALYLGLDGHLWMWLILKQCPG